MDRRLLYMGVLALITLVYWVYWSSETEFNHTLVFLTHMTLNKQTILVPVNSTCKSSPLMIIVVTSYVGHVELRSAHRRSMDSEYLKKYNAERIFLLAKIPDGEKYITQDAINDESNTFGDILQGSFVENYRNLTYKHLMGLDWAARHCSNAKYVLKVDDDTVFNLKATYDLLNKNNYNKDNFLLGYMLNNTKPRRQKNNKWYVSEEEYPRSVYPPYLSGWYYVSTPQTAARLVEEAIYHPYFWIDDLLITGILAEALEIKLKHLPHKFWLEYYELLECCLKDMINKGIRCDYAVGPNGGRNNLIYEFNNAARNCDEWKNCTLRTDDQLLNKVCVAYRERTIFSDGQPEVEIQLL